MSIKFLKYSLFGLIGLTMLAFSPVSASIGDMGEPSMSIPGIYMGTIDFDEFGFVESITIRLGADGTLTYITPSELRKETAAVGSWKRVSKVGGVDVIEFAAVAYIQADEFCSGEFGCVVFGGGTLSINRDGEMEGEIGLSFRPADDDTAPTSHLGIFPMYLQKRSIEEIRSLATTPTP